MVHVRAGSSDPSGSGCPATAITTPAASRAPGTAQRRATRSRTSQVSSTGAIVAGSSASARKGATHRVRRTPASMPLAMGAGIRLTQVPSGRTTAVSR